MIPRYSRTRMSALWADCARYRLWFEIEAHAASAMADRGEIPHEAAAAIWKSGETEGFDENRIDELDRELRHDVLAFLTHLEEKTGPLGRYLHLGLTSSDVLDTALNITLGRAGAILLDDLDRLLKSLKRRAIEHKRTPCIGRSHGVHAEPTTFGLKLASHYAAFSRAQHQFREACRNISTCAISGPVGTFSSVHPDVEAYVAGQFGLTVEPISTQVIPRDRHAEFFCALARIAGSLENLAVEIRHLQRTEVREAEEKFTSGQKGSSSMPHKRNPVLSENVSGLSRIVRSFVVPALENVVLWHERDISHSSAERVMVPDATIALDFALHRMAGIINDLTVYPDRMKENLDLLRGLPFSHSVLVLLVQKGLDRDVAYRAVQSCAARVWDEGLDLFTLLGKDLVVSQAVTSEELSTCFDPERFYEQIDTIYTRVFDE